MLMKRIETAGVAWEAEVLPLNYSPEALKTLGRTLPNKTKCTHVGHMFQT